MFTGLIEQQGAVVANLTNVTGQRLLIDAPFEHLQEGESIAVNGVCLTLLPKFKSHLAFDVSPETLARTTLGALRVGDAVNLERAMTATARFGGHYVSGHVDRTIHLNAVTNIGEYIEMNVGEFKPEEMRFLLPKGSITLDGVSLTINAIENRGVSVLLVPHTLANTTLAKRCVGDYLNVEFDYLTRVVAHQLSLLTQSSAIL
ncbi:riboflavin synthase [Legionella oakridgensis]|uniref:Riboflavin synthase n=2 Tax=Legionella oakridgensis TaxID=29423 RepID=W0BE58_9GAMM|nr:riboflavin synthase [Legionella oakridgensis]AHE66991.1 riboflavin synthase, alpha, subunit [Legionella oakridgensis ATCC 33761 = DSM 21215]ETO93351.1 riboflavin synthase alpha chain [Legionella oakridgensis RV-2-2007]KTD38355.1 riboflavin synthase alpha chain [Legionella oakridgensis]STY20092.1 riboflavin synthase alpha chain [Legionella longbeachae]